MTEQERQIDELASTPIVLTPPAGQEQFVSEARIEPQTAEYEPDKGTKLFVLFFFLIVPPLGVALLVALCWSMWKAFNA